MCWLLKFDLFFVNSYIIKLVNGMFILFKNYALVGVFKGENLEFIFMVFKVRLGYRILLNFVYFIEGNKCFGNLLDVILFM